jgi:hypothetical protein
MLDQHVDEVGDTLMRGAAAEALKGSTKQTRKHDFLRLLSRPSGVLGI